MDDQVLQANYQQLWYASKAVGTLLVLLLVLVLALPLVLSPGFSSGRPT